MHVARFSVIKGKKINPMLLKQLMSSENPQAFNYLGDYFIQRIEKGETKLISLANRYSSEKINPNNILRRTMLHVLCDLAMKGDKRVLRGLLIGAKDKDSANRTWAFLGLKNLAEKEVKETLLGLMEITKMEIKEISPSTLTSAAEGLFALAKQGVHETLLGLIFIAKASLDVRSLKYAKEGIQYLANLKNKDAQKALRMFTLTRKVKK